ncbi:hypothetical protein GW915_07520 [bacterium]|nr:hypothetical protein [bacterium]
MTKKLLLLNISLLSGLSFAMGGSSPSPSPEGVGARWEGRRSEGTSWTRHTQDELRRLAGGLENGIPGDVREFCPEFSSLSDLKVRKFYTYLISAMSELESGHNPNTSYRENFKDSRGRFVVSRGLLQISIESGNAYGCGFQSEQQLHDPFKNLSCGVRIVDRWVNRDGRIAGKVSGSWRGAARYWSVLRTTSKVSQIKSWTKNYCKSL